MNPFPFLFSWIIHVNRKGAVVSMKGWMSRSYKVQNASSHHRKKLQSFLSFGIYSLRTRYYLDDSFFRDKELCVEMGMFVCEAGHPRLPMKLVQTYNKHGKWQGKSHADFMNRPTRVIWFHHASYRKAAVDCHIIGSHFLPDMPRPYQYSKVAGCPSSNLHANLESPIKF